ncbi:porin [Piscinibacter sp.]|jgi:predicted porin|uniref:porin n=1 Tax=Piscinibacter sp. TaxID=1903157 RepID=UPI003559AF92
MKKFATLAGLAVISASAAAQSTVTLYGLLDVGVRDVKNGDLSVKSLSSNGNNTSRLGVKGTEELGDGLKAGFQLETGFTPDTGVQSDATRLWNRRATVSLFQKLGEVRLGRDYTVTYLGYYAYDVWSDIGLSGVAKFDSSLGTTRDTGVRADNQIVYFTPEGLGGFYGQAGVAAGEGISGRKYSAGRAGYAAGRVDVSVTVGQTTVTPVAGDDKFKTIETGASYDFGPVKVSGYYQQLKFAALKATNIYIGAQVPVGRGLVRASYVNSNLSGKSAAGINTDPNDARQVALGYLHNLSKRTAIYTNVVQVTNKGASAIAVDKNPTPLAGKNSAGVEVGVRHSF